MPRPPIKHLPKQPWVQLGPLTAVHLFPLSVRCCLANYSSLNKLLMKLLPDRLQSQGALGNSAPPPKCSNTCIYLKNICSLFLMTLQLFELLSSSGTQMLWLPADRKITFPSSTLKFAWCFWNFMGKYSTGNVTGLLTDGLWSFNFGLTVGIGINAQQRSKLTQNSILYFGSFCTAALLRSQRALDCSGFLNTGGSQNSGKTWF